MKETERNPNAARILTTAAQLFFERGFSTPVDSVVFNSGLAKMSVYRHFPSKTLLVTAAIGESHARLIEPLEALRTGPPVTRDLLAKTLADICDILSSPTSRGSLGSQALVEFRQPTETPHQFAANRKEEFIAVLEKLCAAAGVKNAADIALQLTVLLEGFFVLYPVVGVNTAKRAVSQMTESLLAQA